MTIWNNYALFSYWLMDSWYSLMLISLHRNIASCFFLAFDIIPMYISTVHPCTWTWPVEYVGREDICCCDTASFKHWKPPVICHRTANVRPVVLRWFHSNYWPRIGHYVDIHFFDGQLFQLNCIIAKSFSLQWQFIPGFLSFPFSSLIANCVNLILSSQHPLTWIKFV